MKKAKQKSETLEQQRMRIEQQLTLEWGSLYELLKERASDKNWRKYCKLRGWRI